MSNEKQIDPRELRNAYGTFATGVTVITTTTPEGRREAITANSFSSVSLDPALLLWSIGRDSRSFDAFNGCDHFAIHVLGEDQQELSNRFASKDLTDKFAGFDIEEGIAGLPLLTDYCARFQCSIYNRYEGGDHIILVGRVLDYDTRENDPLVFHGGRYRRIA